MKYPKLSKSTSAGVLVLILIGIGFWAMKNKTGDVPSLLPSNSQTKSATQTKNTTTGVKPAASTGSPVTTANSGWKSYRTDFEIQVPQNWVVNTDFLGNGITTFASTKDVVAGFNIPPSPN